MRVALLLLCALSLLACSPAQTGTPPSSTSLPEIGNATDTKWWRGMSREDFAKTAYRTFCTAEPQECLPYSDYHIEYMDHAVLEDGRRSAAFIQLLSESPRASITCHLSDILNRSGQYRDVLECVGGNELSGPENPSGSFPVVLPDGTAPK